MTIEEQKILLRNIKTVITMTEEVSREAQREATVAVNEALTKVIKIDTESKKK